MPWRKTLNEYFEPVSILYHVFFFSFLIYLIFLRPKKQHINTTFIHFLGLYVIAYGLVITFLGDSIINRDFR